MDYDNDGIMDFISGSYDPGDLYLFRGLGEGNFAAVEKIVDKSGLAVVHHPAEFAKYSKVTDDQDKYSEQNTMLRVASFGSWPATVDWDNDGDLDLLIGSFLGELYLRENEGSRSEPEYSTTNIRVCANGEPIQVNSHCNPVVADWNEDGLWDLVVSASDGSVWWYANSGTRSSPEFAKQKLLVPPSSKHKFLEQNLAKGDEPSPGVRAQICVVDYNLDGRLDLIVGDYSDINTVRDLSETDRAQFDDVLQQENALLEQMLPIQERLMAAAKAKIATANTTAERERAEDAAKSIEEAEYEAMMQKYEALSDQVQQLHTNKQRFFEETRSASFVWLYLRAKEEHETTQPTDPQRLPALSIEANASGAGPVTISASASRIDGTTDQYAISVELDIAGGWHLYGQVPADSPYRSTHVELKLPTGVEAVGEWKLPVALPDLRDPRKRIYTGVATFVRRVELPQGLVPAEVGIEVRYQVCDEQKCLPPANIMRTVVLK